MSDAPRRPPFQALPNGLRILALVVGLGLPIYWWITYSGLYRWLAEVQIGWFDGYYAILTGLLTIVGVLCPAVLLLVPVAKLLEPAPRPGPPDRVEKTPPSPAEQARISDAWIQRNIGWIFLGILLVGLVGTGIYFQIRALSFGEKTRIDLASLERGEAPASDWIEIQARPAWPETIPTKDDRTHWLYTPARTTPGTPAALILEIRGRKADFGRTKWAGTLSRRAPGIVVSALAKRTETVVDRPWVLEVGGSPSKFQAVASGMFGTAVMFLIIGGVVWVVRRRKRRG